MGVLIGASGSQSYIHPGVRAFGALVRVLDLKPRLSSELAPAPLVGARLILARTVAVRKLFVATLLIS